MYGANTYIAYNMANSNKVTLAYCIANVSIYFKNLWINIYSYPYFTATAPAKSGVKCKL